MEEGGNRKWVSQRGNALTTLNIKENFAIWPAKFLPKPYSSSLKNFLISF